MGESDYDALTQEGIISTVPHAGEPNVPAPLEDLLAKGRLAGLDTDYKAKLGIP